MIHKRALLDDGSSVVRKIPNPDAIQHGLVAVWPHPFRPEDYDYGEPVDRPSY